jgi:hypothetical protein
MSFGVIRSTFHKVIGCGLEDRDSNPRQDKDFSLYCHYQTGCQAYLARIQLVLMAESEAGDSLV